MDAKFIHTFFFTKVFLKVAAYQYNITWTQTIRWWW